MVTFVQELVNSLSIASVIILMGIGVTLIFGLTGIINFAHGEFLMLGAIGVWALVGYGFGYIPAVIISVVIVGLIGFLLERGLFQFTLTRPNNGFMASLGLSIVLQHVVIRIWNSFSKSIPEPLPGVWEVGEIRFIKMRVVVVLVTALVVAVTFFTISRSRYGLALRASLADRQTAALMGIPNSALHHGDLHLRERDRGAWRRAHDCAFSGDPVCWIRDDHARLCSRPYRGARKRRWRSRGRTHPWLGQWVQRRLWHAGVDQRLHIRPHDHDLDLPPARPVRRHHGASD